MAESEVIQQASRIVGLIMGGSSIEDAMEEVIGPGDWSEQATELANLIEQAAADQFGRVEDAFYRKDRFEGDNCGIGSEGFKPGNKCGAKRGKGGAKPKGSTPRKPRKKAEPAAEAPAAPEAPESKPKRGRKPKATPAATAAPKPRAPRAKKPKPKPSALQRGREVMHRLGKALRKMGAQTLKGLAKRVRAMRKAGGGLAKAAGRAAGAVAKGAGEAIRRAAPAGRRLAKAHHETGAAVRSATEAASTALDPIRSSALPVSQESVEKISSNLSEISSSISEQPEKDPKKAQQSANRSMALIREIKSNAEMKKLQALLKKSKDPGAMQWRSKVDAFMGSIKALETAAKSRKAAADAWANQSRKKGKMSKRIEDKFYFSGDNCGTGAGGFKPGNKCGQRDGASGSDETSSSSGGKSPKPSAGGNEGEGAKPSKGKQQRAQMRQARSALKEMLGKLKGTKREIKERLLPSLPSGATRVWDDAMETLGFATAHARHARSLMQEMLLDWNNPNLSKQEKEERRDEYAASARRLLQKFDHLGGALTGSAKELEKEGGYEATRAAEWLRAIVKDFESLKDMMSKRRIEDKFYFGRRKVCFEGDNCGIGSEGFKPGNKCGAKRGKGGSKSKPKGKGKAKPAPKPSPEGPWPKRDTPSAGERRRAAGEPSKRLGDAVVSGLSKFSDPASVIATLSKESGHAGVDPVTRAAAEAIKKISELREQLSYHAFRVARGKTESREELRSYAKQAMEALATIAASRASLQKGMEKLNREDKRLDQEWEKLYAQGGTDTPRHYRRREQIRDKAYDNLQARRQTRRALRALDSVPDFSEELKQLMRI